MTKPSRAFWRVGAILAVLVVLAPSAPVPLRAQQQEFRADVVLPPVFQQGYVRALGGDVIVYPWAYPGQIDTLLSRATDGHMAVEWEGEPVPAGPADDFITYLWHAGMATGYGAHAFTISVNDRVCASFRTGRTTEDREWGMRGVNGSELWFKTTRVGAFNELFGFMWVRAPRSFFGSGAPRFRVVGEAAGNQDYYLGEKAPVRSWVRVRAEEAVLAGGHRAVRLESSIVGSAAQVVLRTGATTLWTGTAEAGHTSMMLPAGQNQDTVLPLQVELDGRLALEETLQLKRVQPREIHLLPHSHVDIGYSDPQAAVERKQWKNLRDAVELARKTASYPPEARFKWNVEGLWSVESYLKQASLEDRQAFTSAVKAGSIGLQANYTNVLTGLMSPEELRHWTDASRQMQAAYGFAPMRSAMHSDIPGLSWTVVAALAQSGVRYFSSGPNYVPGFPDLGDRIGTTIKTLGDKPFWWTSPSGEERLLFWMAGHGYSWFHGLNTGKMSETSRDAILDYVSALVSKGYQWDLIQVRYTVGGDNGPTDPDLPDVVRHWNEQFETPRLVISTTEALFADMEKRHGAALPVMSGDMTPYWEDGALSTAYGEALVRAAARRLAQAQTLFALRFPKKYPAAQLAEAWRNVLLWHEHTWGAADSISQPDRPDVVAQFAYKWAFAMEATGRSGALLNGAMSESGEVLYEPHAIFTIFHEVAESIDVVNTLAWNRKGLVFLPAAMSQAGNRVTGPGGRALPSQRLKDGRLAVWLSTIPALGAVRVRVEPGEAAIPEAAAVQVSASALDNGSTRIEFDRAIGTISRYVRRVQDEVLFVAQPPIPTPAQTFHDVPIGAGLLDYLYVSGRDPGDAQHAIGATISVVDSGPLVGTVRIESVAPGAASLVRTVQMTAGSDDVLVTVDVDKTKVRTKESAHLAFPLTVPGGVVRFDEGEAIIEPGKNQLPGSCRDFIGVSNAFDVSGALSGISIASLDAPLIELGALTDERQGPAHVRAWRDTTAPGSNFYAYLLNNYWHTNYKADQSGPLRFRFVMRAHGPFDAATLRMFSAQQDQPLLPIGAAATAPPLGAPFTVYGPDVVATLVEVVDGGKALTIRLYNAGATRAMAVVTPTSPDARLLGIDAPSVSGNGGVVGLPPHATRTLRLEVK